MLGVGSRSGRVQSVSLRGLAEERSWVDISRFENPWGRVGGVGVDLGEVWYCMKETRVWRFYRAMIASL